MKEHLNKRYSSEPLNSNLDNSFRVVFFKLYDRKIMNGDITFSRLEMDKEIFICLSTGQEIKIPRSEIIRLCVNMGLNEKESDMMMESAGYKVICYD